MQLASVPKLLTCSAAGECSATPRAGFKISYPSSLRDFSNERQSVPVASSADDRRRPEIVDERTVSLEIRLKLYTADGLTPGRQQFVADAPDRRAPNL